MRIEQILSGGVLALLLVPGCWITQQQQALDAHGSQLGVVQGRSAALERAVLEYEDRLARLEESMRTAGASQAAKLENIDEVNSEVNRLRGEIEVIRFELDGLKRTFDDLVIDFDQRQLYDEARLRQLERFLNVTPPPMPTTEPECDPSVEDCEDPADSGGDANPTDPQAEDVPETAKGKLELASEHIAAGRSRVARAVLEKALGEHKGAPEIPEIRYRLGETWFNEKNWGKAVGAFQSVIENHPDSEWAPWAMLRQGECFGELGQNDNAQLFFQEVIRVHPGTPAAKDAKKLLE